MSDHIPPSFDRTFLWLDGDEIYGEFGWTTSPDFAEDWDGDEPREYVEERWTRTEVIVHTAFPPLYECTYEDDEPCEEDAVVWQREDDVWMAACAKHRHPEEASRG